MATTTDALNVMTIAHVAFCSCNNVAPVTNLCLGRATTRSHSSQWNKKKLQLKHKNSLFTLQTFHYNYYWWSQSLLNWFGWEIYAFQRLQQPCSNLSIVFHNRKLRKEDGAFLNMAFLTTRWCKHSRLKSPNMVSAFK